MIRSLHVLPEAGISGRDREYLLIGIPPFEFGWLRHRINSTLGPGIPAFMRFLRIRMGQLFQQTLPKGAKASRIAMASSTQGVLITQSIPISRVWTTANGGMNWTAYQVPFVPLNMVLAGHGAYWAIGTSRSAWRLVHRYEQQHGNNPKAVKIYDLKHPLHPYLYHFSHGQWSKALLPQTGFPLGLRFLGSQFGYFWTSHNLVTTTNGGKTWTRHLIPPGTGVTSIWFMSSRLGWLTSDNGAPLYHTTDGGATWVSGA